MAKKKPNPGQQTFEGLEPEPRLPAGYYSGDQPNPKLRGLANGWTEEDDRILAEIHRDRKRGAL